MPSSHDIPIEVLRQSFRYDDGKLFWVSRPRTDFINDYEYNYFISNSIGKEAGSTNLCGKKENRKKRCFISICNQRVGRHRIIYAMFHGRWVKEVDHIDEDTTNDRIDNLRECTRGENNVHQPRRKDNTSGYKGVTWDNQRNKWKSRIYVNGKPIHLGFWDDVHIAGEAVKEAGKKYYGDFHNMNDPI